jgi:hypothetical protein
MKKNVASQVIGAQMVNATTGAAFTSAVTVYVTGDAGTQAVGSVGAGACTHEGNGFHTYAPAQAETNYDHIAFTFIGTGAIPATVQVFTTFPQTGDNFARLGAPAGASVSADVAAIKAETATILSDTNDIQTRLPAALVSGRMDSSVGAMAANVLTAAATAADFTTEVTTGLSTLDAAGVRTAVGLATANLDTQLDALPTAAEIADAVWDEALAGHAGAGSAGEALSAAGTAGDPWLTALPGAYGAGTAGKIVGDNINATISSRATQTSVDDLPTNAELATALGTADDAVLAVLGTPAGVSLAADVAAVKAQTAAIETDTQDIQGRLPAALVSGRMDASVGAMAANVMTAAAAAADLTTELQSGLATAAALATVDGIVDNLVSGIIFGAAATGTLTTTVATSNLTGYGDDQFIGRVLIWLTGACEGEATTITDYASASGTLTFTALTTAPANADTFKIV